MRRVWVLMGGKVQTLARLSASGFALRGAGMLGGLVTSVILARALGPAEYGLYAFAIATVGMLAMPVLIGLPTLLVRETAASMAKGQSERLIPLSRWTLGVIGAGSLAVFALVLGVIGTVPGLQDDPRVAVLVLALPMVPILALGQARSALLRGLGHVGQGLLPETLVRPLALIVGLIAAMALLPGPMSATRAMVCLIAAGLVSFATGAWLLHRAWPEAPARVATWDPAWTRAILPLSLIGGLQMVNTNIDLVLIGILRSPAEAGQYRIAVSGAVLGLFALTTLRIVLQSRIADLAAKGDLAQLQRVISTAALIATCASMSVLLVVLVAGAPLITTIFGAAFGDATGPLTVLLAGNVALSLMAMSTPILTMSGGERRVLPGLAASALLNVGLNLWLIPAHGPLGAALATVLALNVGQWITFRRALVDRGLDASPWPLILQLRPALTADGRS